MMHRFTLIVAVVLAGQHVGAQTPDSMLTRSDIQKEHKSAWNEPDKLARQNPAYYENAYGSSLTEFYMTADWQNRTDRFVMQEGRGHALPEIKAESYIRLSDHTSVWGMASYMNGKSRDVKWNSVADYNLLEPDVLGDTVGGDTRRERYAFDGGYATRLGRWRLGGEMVFRAEQEYRKVDPRMRSVVSDLTLRAGVGLDVRSYSVGLAAEVNIYRQTNSVDFYKPMGSIPEYQMMGLGEVYTRFSSDVNDLYFRGGGFKVQADVQPLAGSGFFGTLWMAEHDYERIARLLNSLPLTTLYSEEVGARAGWKRSKAWDIAAWGDFRFVRRTSDQHLAGTSTSQVYPIIADLTMYHDYVSESSLSVMIGQRRKADWHVKMRGGYAGRRQSYVYPRRWMDYGHAFGEIGGQVIMSVSDAWTLNCGIDGAYRGGTNDRILMPYADMEPYFAEMVNHNYRYLKADYTSVSARVRADWHMPRLPYSVFGEVAFGESYCSEGARQTSAVLTVGITL